MRRFAPAILLTGLLGLASAALAGDDPCRDSHYAGDLSALFVPPREFGIDWESVRETPSDPADDPDLRAVGVRALVQGRFDEACSRYQRALRGIDLRPIVIGAPPTRTSAS